MWLSVAHVAKLTRSLRQPGFFSRYLLLLVLWRSSYLEDAFFFLEGAAFFGAFFFVATFFFADFLGAAFFFLEGAAFFLDDVFFLTTISHSIVYR